ncbi:MAG: hypothetical protein ACREXP_05125 [Steroidobacteraceae bacterium]
MRILLLCSAFNGLTQRAWIELRAKGHEVTLQLAGDEKVIREAVAAVDPELIICPFLRERVPAEVWKTAARSSCIGTDWRRPGGQNRAQDSED